jgi:hypothetical protein
MLGACHLSVAVVQMVLPFPLPKSEHHVQVPCPHYLKITDLFDAMA